MTHPTFDKLREWISADETSSDSYLSATLFELEHSKLFAEFEAEREFLDRELSTPEMIERLKSALADSNDYLRGASAKRLILTGHPESEAILLRFLRSENPEDRHWVAAAARFVNSDEVSAEIAKVATQDPASYVRAEACKGMQDKDPRMVIPVLIEVMYQGEEGIDPASQSMPPCVIAREVLEKILGVSIFNPNGCLDQLEYDRCCATLEEKALEMLRKLNCATGSM